MPSCLPLLAHQHFMLGNVDVGRQLSMGRFLVLLAETIDWSAGSTLPKMQGELCLLERCKPAWLAGACL